MDIQALHSAASATGPKSELASKTLAKDFDTFLTLLTTQLQYQDPLDPMDSTEFTQQLVQFSGVEQAIQTNKNLEQLVSSLNQQTMNQSVGYLGKEVTIKSPIARLDSDGATWFYELDTAAENTEIKIKDDSGRVVMTMPGDMRKGLHKLDWDGRLPNGTRLPDGEYTLEVKATSGANTVKTSTYIRDLVTSVEHSGGTSYLGVGSQAIPMNEILAVYEPAKSLVQNPPVP